MRMGDLMITSSTFSSSWYYVKLQLLMLLGTSFYVKKYNMCIKLINTLRNSSTEKVYLTNILFVEPISFLFK